MPNISIRSAALAVALIVAFAQGPAGAQSDNAGALQQRIDQLEEQLVDMQVVVGTLESLARGGTPSTTSGGFETTTTGAAADLEGRVSGLEGQMALLSKQLADLSAQMQAINRKLGIAGGGQQGSLDTGGIGSDDAGFGQVTVEPAGSEDSIGSILGSDQELDLGAEAAGAGGAGVQAGQQTAAIATGGGDPDKMYEEAYGLLLQQDYAAAESSFAAFLAQHPDNRLAGNAQYWLGETYYVRGQYKPAAESFLKVYDKYKTSQKAPDSLLKLAMSLSRLGQRESACSAFDALDADYPNAPQSVKRRATSERERAGC
jgi:tol-pal system protein YbgF